MQEKLSPAEYLRLEEKHWQVMAIRRAHLMDAPEYAPTGGARRLPDTPCGPGYGIHPCSVRLRSPS